jgi:glycosyltransferase involved in cell wall biosynthesis
MLSSWRFAISKSQLNLMKSVGIICPVFNEEECIPLFFDRLKAVLEEHWDDYEFSLLFMNNASTDHSLAQILTLREEHDWVDVISLSRNFGYQASLMCGLNNEQSDATIVIDVDCEDPPEMISTFLHKWEEGYDVVYGERTNRPESQIIQLCRKAFYRLTSAVSDNDFVLDMAEFSLFSRAVRETLVFNKSSYPFIRTEIGYAGFRRLGVSYSRQPRVSGETHYNLTRMVLFAVGGILSSSTFPLRLVVYLGVPLFILDMVALVLVQTPMLMSKVFLLNLMVLLLGVTCLSIYSARTYKDGLRKPLYIIDEETSYRSSEIKNFNRISS